MNKTEIQALISLLDDPDEEVFGHIKDKLLSMGNPIIPDLESAWENCFDTIIQNRIENIIHKIQFEATLKELIVWAKSKDQDLLEGSILISRYQYPDLDEKKLRKKIEQVKQDVWIEINQNLTALEKVKIINHIVFDVHSFSGNTSNYHAPQNSYLNNVLESKKGNPLSLSILYTIIAQDLDLPIYGVNLPEHFILAYKDEEHILPVEHGDDADSILFYINPFSRGTVFGRKEIDAFLKQLKLPPDLVHYLPCSNVDMIIRMLRNLINSYDRLGYAPKKEELTIILETLTKAKQEF